VDGAGPCPLLSNIRQNGRAAAILIRNIEAAAAFAGKLISIAKRRTLTASSRSRLGKRQ
jgi:hypothetical protein